MQVRVYINAIYPALSLRFSRDNPFKCLINMIYKNNIKLRLLRVFYYTNIPFHGAVRKTFRVIRCSLLRNFLCHCRHKAPGVLSFINWLNAADKSFSVS